MKQNINLYQPVTSGARDGLNARVLLIAWGTIGAVAVMAQSWLAHSKSGQQEQLQSLQQKIETTEKTLNTLTASSMAGTDPVLEARLNEALRELDLQQTILGLVSGNRAGDIDGFSRQLVSLARQDAAGVWLTRVRISAPGGKTTLEGKALSPAAVPLYLQQLSGEAALAGQGFDVFEIRQPEQPGDAVEFSLNRRDDDSPVQLVRQ